VKKEFILVSFLVLFFLFIPKQVFADTLASMSDTISTSRPSSAAVLSADQAASAGQVSTVDNGSLWLASDSAILKNDTGETLNTASVASQSGVVGGVKIVYFYSPNPANTHHKGDPIIAAISSMHTVQFTSISTIPLSGTITLTFPVLTVGDANNPASPSASTFQMNGLAIGTTMITKTHLGTTTDITTTYFNSNGGGMAITNPSGGTSPTIVLTMANNQSIPGGDTVTIFLGCTAVNTGTNTCSTQSPRIINPTQNNVTTGTGRSWKIKLTTQDAGANPLDNGSIAIATVDSVRVRANVDAFLTLTIAGINNGTTISADDPVASCNSDGSVTNTGLTPSAASVDLGDLGGGISIAAQKITVTTNGQGGYTLTATSSGHLINPANGYWLYDTTTPTVMTGGTTFFGIHPCGTNTSAATWVNGGPGSGKFAWPTQAGGIPSLASQSPGPIGPGTGRVNDGITDVEYASTIASIVPAGEYETAITYVATATF